jgi:hypothetical protein
MKIINLKQNIRLAVMLGVIAFASLSAQSALAGDKLDVPALPPACSTIQAPQGNKLAFRAYAVGVQVYRWNGVRWDFVAPIAKLFADPNYNGLVGSHFAGPTWMSNSGSTVIAARVDGCSPEATAIPWLLLKATTSDCPGVFSKTTFIQRLNTSGGREPDVPAATIGYEIKVPYTAEYYFYQADN